MQSKNHGKYIYVVVIASLLLITVWLIWGTWLFGYANTESLSWSRGEIGDYIGGGLGGIAAFGVLYTLLLQGQQLNDQKIQESKAATLRVFELLKPEVENLSARIISKVDLSELKDGEAFEEMYDKFTKFDRTVFLRAMQKIENRDIFRPNQNNTELNKAATRFKLILDYLCKELDAGSIGSDDGFSDAIRQTEMYQTYTICFDVNKSNSVSK